MPQQDIMLCNTFLLDMRKIILYNIKYVLFYERQTFKRCVMETKVILNKQDLTFLKWSHLRNSSGTAGTFLKSESVIEGKKLYYKLSNFDPVHGIIGHECVNELIVDRLLNILGIDHIHYHLIFYRLNL